MDAEASETRLMGERSPGSTTLSRRCMGTARWGERKIEMLWSGSPARRFKQGDWQELSRSDNRRDYRFQETSFSDEPFNENAGPLDRGRLPAREHP